MTPEPTPDLDAATLAELHRLARSRPQSGRGQTAKLGAIRTLERLGREGKSTSRMPAAVARLFDPSRDESERVRRDDWHPDPDSALFGLDLVDTVGSRRGWYRNLAQRGRL